MRRGQVRREAHFGVLVALFGSVLGSAPALAAESLDGVESQVAVYQNAADAAPCDLDWSLLGGIAGFVSDHGRVYQAVPPAEFPTVAAVEFVGSTIFVSRSLSLPAPVPIRGEALDGVGGRLLIEDTDGGAIDGDARYDRAVGPFQFIPSTWVLYATDGDDDGIADPDDIVDAAFSAAAFLCDVGAADDPDDALHRYFGTDSWDDQVATERAAVRAFERRLHPTQLVAGPQASLVPDDLTIVADIVVHKAVAADVAAMVAAAAADGIMLAGSGFRTHERQIELRAAHCADIWLTPPEDCSPPTAIPGTSLHETGHAIDFADPATGQPITAGSEQFEWLEANAADYGFANLPSESWHWSTTGG